ncbi:hypothetical protein L596_029662 [Steinernema carpocapsae]|uniref:Uncharacterized protein n=1 Tax=Steinernema carpocapsae TaxID=34508 RepID=A0A4U5LVC7_STECR|nr:hypothetical protein L596_029662 [Steinernema carpocapsae]
MTMFHPNTTILTKHESEGYGSLESEDDSNGFPIPSSDQDEPAVEDLSYDFEAFHSPVQFKSINQVLEDSKSYNLRHGYKKPWEIVPMTLKASQDDDCIPDFIRQAKDFSAFVAKSMSLREFILKEDNFKDGVAMDEVEEYTPSLQFDFDPFAEDNWDNITMVQSESVNVKTEFSCQTEMEVEEVGATSNFEIDPFNDGDMYSY